MIEWRDGLVRWRPSLSPTDRQSYGATARSDCRDLKFFVGRINFEQLGAQRAFELNSIPTSLSQQDVERLISAGQDALRSNITFRAFLRSINGKVSCRGFFEDPVRCSREQDALYTLNPPTLTYAIMGRVCPYRGENNGPGMDARELDNDARN